MTRGQQLQQEKLLWWNNKDWLKTDGSKVKETLTSKKVKGGNGDVGDSTWGGEHTMQCTDDVLDHCTPETCKILLTSVTQFKKMKIKENGIIITKTCTTSRRGMGVGKCHDPSRANHFRNKTLLPIRRQSQNLVPPSSETTHPYKHIRSQELTPSHALTGTHSGTASPRLNL